jgi:hypothetical protein
MSTEYINKFMNVSNGSGWVKRFVLFKNKNGSFIAVHKNDMNLFEDGSGFRSSKWKRAKDIPQKTYRNMTNREIFEALRNQGCWLKHNLGFETNFWDSRSPIEEYTITYDFGKTFHELKVEDLK